MAWREPPGWPHDLRGPARLSAAAGHAGRRTTGHRRAGRPCGAVTRAVALVGRTQCLGQWSAHGGEPRRRTGPIVVVVSGLARGIDAAAHTGALRTGRTVAAVAGGLDMPYPPEHADLQRRIAEAGAVVTEAPLGTTPQARHFPRRNRIIAGLSLGRRRGGGGAALRQPDHRAAGPGSRARTVRRAGLAARSALARRQRPDPPGCAPDRDRRRTCWTTCRTTRRGRVSARDAAVRARPRARVRRTARRLGRTAGIRRGSGAGQTPSH